MAASTNSANCPAANQIGFPSSITCPGDAGECLPIPNMGCSCSGTTLTCNTITDAGVTQTLTLDFSMTDFTGTATASEGGITCSYTLTSSM